MKGIKLLIIATALASNLYSQECVRRLFLRDSVLNANFTRRYNSCALAFKSPLCCDPDTIWVSVMSDSLDETDQTLSL